MHQCPTCNAAIWIGQSYCSTCDRYLPDPGEEDRFCPQCRIAVGPQQKICHKCFTSLAETPEVAFPAPAGARRFFPWVPAILIGASTAIMVLFLNIYRIK